MRKVLLSVMLMVSSLVSSAQSYDERIAGAMNAGDWFALDSIYKSAPKIQYHHFLKSFQDVSSATASTDLTFPWPLSTNCSKNIPHLLASTIC